MSINQDTLDDLASTTGKSPEELLQTAPQGEAPVGQAVSVMATPRVGNDQTPLTDEVKAQLMNPNTKLTSIRNEIESTETLGDLHKEIADSAAISAQDAINIAPHLESFSSVFKTNSFTKMPSGVNFREATAYLDGQLTLRRESICLQYSQFSDSISDAAEAFVTHRDFISVELAKCLQDFQAQTLEWKKNPLHIAAQNLPINGGDFNAAEGLLKKEDMGVRLSEFYNQDAFAAYCITVVSLNSVLEKYLTASKLIQVLLEGKGVNELISAAERVEAYGAAVSPMMLIDAFAQPYALTFLKEFETRVESSLKTLKDLESSNGIDGSDYPTALAFVLKNGEALDDAALSAHYYAESLDIMRRLMPIAQAFLDYFVAEK